jgi:ferric iron reductase protein FhuF
MRLAPNGTTADALASGASSISGVPVTVAGPPRIRTGFLHNRRRTSSHSGRHRPEWQAGRISASASLRSAAAIGPYFAVELEPTGLSWLPLRALLDDLDVVRERVEFVREALALRCGVPADRIDVRASASIHFLGLVARLVAPVLAAASLDAVVPVFGPDDVRWQRVDGGPVPIGLTAAHGIPVASTEPAAARLGDGVLRAVVAPLVGAFCEAAQLSPTVLWGNVASGLAGAASMLSRSGTALTLDPAAIVASIFASPSPLLAAGEFDVHGRFFVRASCCLFYRVPNGGKCGDCVLL